MIWSLSSQLINQINCYFYAIGFNWALDRIWQIKSLKSLKLVEITKINEIIICFDNVRSISCIIWHYLIVLYVELVN